MCADTREQFDAGAKAWVGYNQTPLGHIRGSVTWHNLSRHLPVISDPANPPLVLDLGGGSGELAIRLAKSGYRTWLVDYAPAMLEQARLATRALPPEVGDRLTLCHVTADELLQTFPPANFDTIACHTLIEYLPHPNSVLRAAAQLLSDGGALSVSFVSRHAGVLRRVWSEADPTRALAELEGGGAFCANLFGLEGQAYAAETVRDWLEHVGLEVEASYGVRIFADYLPRERLNDLEFYEALLRLEVEASSRDPYRSLARYIHLIARRGAGPVSGC